MKSERLFATEEIQYHGGLMKSSIFQNTVESRFKKDFGSDKNLSKIEILSYFERKKTLEKA